MSSVVPRRRPGQTRLRYWIARLGAQDLADPIEFGGRYHAHAKIGDHGQASVFIATTDLAGLRQPVALKKFHAEYAEHHLPRIERSLRTHLFADRQGVPVPAVIDADLDPVGPWVGTELVGRSLASWSRPMTGRRAADVMTSLCESVARLHGAGVVHRDITPGNVIAEPMAFARVYLIDFDLSRDASDSTLTATNMQFGTLPYAPPEQVLGRARDLTPSADVFGVASTLIWALLTRARSLSFRTTGRHPKLQASLGSISQTSGTTGWKVHLPLTPVRGPRLPRLRSVGCMRVASHPRGPGDRTLRTDRPGMVRTGHLRGVNTESPPHSPDPKEDVFRENREERS